MARSRNPRLPGFDTGSHGLVKQECKGTAVSLTCGLVGLAGAEGCLPDDLYPRACGEQIETRRNWPFLETGRQLASDPAEYVGTQLSAGSKPRPSNWPSAINGPASATTTLIAQCGKFTIQLARRYPNHRDSTSTGLVEHFPIGQSGNLR